MAVAPSAKFERWKLGIALRAPKHADRAEPFGTGKRRPPETEPFTTGECVSKEWAKNWQAGIRNLALTRPRQASQAVAHMNVERAIPSWCHPSPVSEMAVRHRLQRAACAAAATCPSCRRTRGTKREEGAWSHSLQTHLNQSPQPKTRRRPLPSRSLPRPSSASIMVAVVNRARRGVGNIGLLQDWAMCK